MRNARFDLLVLPRAWRGSVETAVIAARRIDGHTFPKHQAGAFETFAPVVIVAADDVLRVMMRNHNRVVPMDGRRA